MRLPGQYQRKPLLELEFDSLTKILMAIPAGIYVGVYCPDLVHKNLVQ
jgi:hypothetical protein